MKLFNDYIKPKARDEPEKVVKGRFKVVKAVDDEDKHLVFGWASVAIKADGEQIEDWYGDMIDTAELEAAVYHYVKLYREGGEMHERGGTGVMIESMMFTKEKFALLGLEDNALPEGWWIGFEITDMSVWEKVKDGTYAMFSIEGGAVREKVET